MDLFNRSKKWLRTTVLIFENAAQSLENRIRTFLRRLALRLPERNLITNTRTSPVHIDNNLASISLGSILSSDKDRTMEEPQAKDDDYESCSDSSSENNDLNYDETPYNNKIDSMKI
jgi:hypothetical protein